MKEYHTKYGQIKGISNIDFYNKGAIKECKLNEFSELTTTYGNFVPQYDDTEVRRKYKKSLSFYESGNIQSISFQQQTFIDTSIGKIPAELALFYKNGSIKRIFPLNGKLTAYWTEEDEYRLAQEIDLNFEFGSYKKKIISISFYESGAVKSVTLWPKDFINIPSPYGFIETRIGLSLYPNGAIKSCEPRRQTLIKTSIGELHAYNLEAIGISGDENSLNFNEEGCINALRTSTDKITMTNSTGDTITWEPTLKANNFNNTIIDVLPLTVEFYSDKIRINGNQHNLKDNSFYVEKFVRKII